MRWESLHFDFWHWLYRISAIDGQDIITMPMWCITDISNIFGRFLTSAPSMFCDVFHALNIGASVHTQHSMLETLSAYQHQIVFCWLVVATVDAHASYEIHVCDKFLFGGIRGRNIRCLGNDECTDPQVDYELWKPSPTCLVSRSKHRTQIDIK